MIFFRDKINKRVNLAEAEKRRKEEGPLELEKGDRMAIFLAAVWTFLPVLAGMVAVVLVLTWLFTR